MELSPRFAVVLHLGILPAVPLPVTPPVGVGIQDKDPLAFDSSI